MTSLFSPRVRLTAFWGPTRDRASGPGPRLKRVQEAPGEAGTPDGPEVGASGEGLGSAQADALAEVSTVSMGSASTALSSILGHKVTSPPPR